eukprot:6980009-Pyramimonas_sp.AAC.1
MKLGISPYAGSALHAPPLLLLPLEHFSDIRTPPESRANQFAQACTCLIEVERAILRLRQPPRSFCRFNYASMPPTSAHPVHVVSCRVVSFPVLSGPVLSCPVSCPVVSGVLSCPIVSCRVLSCPVVSCR